jgi:hypothetical protein
MYENGTHGLNKLAKVAGGPPLSLSMAFTFHPRIKWLMGALLLCFIAFIRPSDVFIYMHSPFQDGDKTQSVPGMINKGSGYAGEVLFVL